MIPIETIVADATARRVSEALKYQSSMKKQEKLSDKQQLTSYY
jgi:hypothetical protein